MASPYQLQFFTAGQRLDRALAPGGAGTLRPLFPVNDLPRPERTGEPGAPAGFVRAQSPLNIGRDPGVKAPVLRLQNVDIPHKKKNGGHF